MKKDFQQDCIITKEDNEDLKTQKFVGSLIMIILIVMLK